MRSRWEAKASTSNVVTYGAIVVNSRGTTSVTRNQSRKSTPKTRVVAAWALGPAPGLPEREREQDRRHEQQQTVQGDGALAERERLGVAEQGGPRGHPERDASCRRSSPRGRCNRGCWSVRPGSPRRRPSTATRHRTRRTRPRSARPRTCSGRRSRPASRRPTAPRRTIGGAVRSGSSTGPSWCRRSAPTPMRRSELRFLVNISTTPARSLIRNQCLSSRVFIGFEMNGRLITGGVGSGGDCVGPPPSRSLNQASARKPEMPTRDQVDGHTGDDVVDTEDGPSRARAGRRRACRGASRRAHLPRRRSGSRSSRPRACP